MIEEAEEEAEGEEVVKDVGKFNINMAIRGTNICFRCGKTRIAGKTYKEYVGNSLVVTTLYSCPDPECQAVIDKQLAKEQKVRDDMKLASERRIAEKKKESLEEKSVRLPLRH